VLRLRAPAPATGTQQARRAKLEASLAEIDTARADGVLVTDADNKITLFNASGQRILDLSAAQVIGYSLEMFSGLFGKSGRAWLQTINAWTGDPTAGQTGASYLDQITLENGRIVAVSVAPVFLRSQFMGTVSIFRDITAEVRVDRLKSEFVANVSHELRTPMTSIKGYVDIMLMGAAGPLSQQQTHFLEVVRSNTQRLNVLVNDLLDVSRIEAGRVILSVQPLDLTEIAQDVANDILGRSREENKPIAIRVEAQPGLPHVEGDLERISQVITNLVGNAYNYTPDGGEVLIRLHEAGGEVQVDVQDNGIGIALEEQHRIFERFYRGEDPLVLKTAGTGLGLSIVKNLVEMHHGRIWFNSPGAPGLGSTFSFTLPVRQAMESEATV
jgi:signal transduction histidine kinase